MAITVQINGITGLKNTLDKLNFAVATEVGNEIKSSALNIQKEAKRLAPVNFGTLRSSINIKRLDKLSYKVEAGASYAPYLEFGTGGKVSVPVGYENYAMSFKGNKGGTYYDFLMAIVEWIKKKGIKAGVYSVSSRRRIGNKTQKFDEDVKMAERIAYSILKKGIRPQPFLIPAFQKEIPELFLRLKKIINVKS